MACMRSGGWKALVSAVLMVSSLGCGAEEASGPEPLPELTPQEPRESQVPVPSSPEGELEETPAPAPAKSPEPQGWFRRVGGPQDDIGTSVAVDGEGEVAWAWVSTPRVDEDREPVEGEKLAISVGRYTAAGEPRWTREFPRNRVEGLRVGASGDGAVYLGGNAFLYSVDFGLGEAQDGFLVRFSPAGEPTWQQRVGQKVRGLAVDAAGGVLASGEEWTAEAHVPLLTRYAADGTERWTRWLEGAGEGTVPGPVALLPSEQAVLTATLSGALELDGQGFGTEGARSLAVFVFDAQGNLTWGQALEGVEGRITDVKAGLGGSVVVVGEAQGAVSWGGTTLPDGGPFVLTMEAQGGGWLRRLGCEGTPSTPSLAVTGTGEVVAACGSRLSLYTPEGTPRGERTLRPESCTEGACTLSSAAVAATEGGLVVTGQQRHGVTTDGWNQDAFLRFVVP